MEFHGYMSFRYSLQKANLSGTPLLKFPLADEEGPELPHKLTCFPEVFPQDQSTTHRIKSIKSIACIMNRTAMFSGFHNRFWKGKTALVSLCEIFVTMMIHSAN